VKKSAFSLVSYFSSLNRFSHTSSVTPQPPPTTPWSSLHHQERHQQSSTSGQARFLLLLLMSPPPRGGRYMILHAMAKWLTWSLGRASDHVSLGRTCSGPTQCKRRERLGLLGHSWPNLTQLSHAYPNIFNNNIIIL
jgi:hypothetical protein